MKTLVQAEADFQHAAMQVLSEKNLLSKAGKVDALIGKMAEFVQVAGHEIRNLKNRIEGV